MNFPPCDVCQASDVCSLRIPRTPFHDNACWCVGNLAFQRKRQRVKQYAYAISSSTNFFEIFLFLPMMGELLQQKIQKSSEGAESIQKTAFYCARCTNFIFLGVNFWYRQG